MVSFQSDKAEAVSFNFMESPSTFFQMYKLPRTTRRQKAGLQYPDLGAFSMCVCVANCSLSQPYPAGNGTLLGAISA